MRQETITRLRNVFAQVALELLDEPAGASAEARRAPPFSSMTEADWRDAVRLWRQHAGTLLAAVPARRCPACGGQTSRWLFQSYDAHPFHECDDCGCWFEPKLIDATVFDALFAASPEAARLADRMMNARDHAAGRDADMARVGGYLDDLLPLLPVRAGQPIAYLDAGCGVGHSLRAGLARGLQVQGIEVDRTALGLARADGLPVASLSDPVPAGPYQLLSFWETLEHIASPLDALNRYLPHLADDGVVAITVPNLNALTSRTMREACAWVHGGYNTAGHINLFHPRSLTRLLDRAGLTLLDADGLFSADPLEIAAYLGGATRGAFDALDPSLTRAALPAWLQNLLLAAWPGAAVVERLALGSPILQVVACRRGQESGFAPAIAARRARRRRHIEQVARDLIAGEPDYKAMSAALQEEVNRRDTEIGVRDREIGRRDETISEKNAAINRVTAMLQQEINLRDDLLQQAQDRFNRTINGRAGAAIHTLAEIGRRLGIVPKP